MNVLDDLLADLLVAPPAPAKAANSANREHSRGPQPDSTAAIPLRILASATPPPDPNSQKFADIRKGEITLQSEETRGNLQDSQDSQGVPEAAHDVTCAGCRHRLRHGTCGEPIAAGLSDRFMIVLAPAGHVATCTARTPTSPAKAVSRPFRLTKAATDAAHAVSWDDDACARFEARTAAIQLRGFVAQDAEDLGERLHLLDVQAEGRVLCPGCGHLRGSARIGWRCGNHTQAQVGRELPLALVTQPQRCLGFATSR